MSKKKKAAVGLGATVGSLAAVFGVIFGVNTLLDKQKTEQYSVSEPIHELVVGTGAGDVDIVATWPTTSPCVRRPTGSPTSLAEEERVRRRPDARRCRRLRRLDAASL